MSRKILFFCSFVLLIVLAACAGSGAAPTARPPADEATPAGETTPDPDQAVLRIALIPVLDVLPAFIAQEKGYFTDEGVSVTIVPVSSALEREQFLAAGEVEGVLTDVIGPAITNAAAQGPSVRIVATTRRSTENSPLFRILASPGSGITTPQELAGMAIGISENSVIQYLGDRLLQAAGLSADEIVYESVPGIPDRFNLMMEGQLAAAILPDPLAQAAIEAGAILVLDDTAVAGEALSQSVLSFRNSVLEERAEAVRAFLRAWNRAVQDLNADPENFRQLWLDNTNVPESVQETYIIPPFPEGEITGEAVWNDVNEWLLSRGIIRQPASYVDSVDVSFLPE